MAQKQFVRKIGELPIERLTGLEWQRSKSDVMELVAEASLNHFLEGFRKGGYMTDASAGGWKRRKNNVDPGRGILIGKGAGHLWKDINVQTVTDSLIVIGTKRIPYAARHNEGLKGMPQREFIGPTKALEIANLNTISVDMKKPLTAKIA